MNRERAEVLRINLVIQVSISRQAQQTAIFEPLEKVHTDILPVTSRRRSSPAIRWAASWGQA